MCSRLSRVSRHLRRVGEGPTYVSTICGAVSIVCASFSLLPYLDVLRRRRLHFLIRPSDCLSWYCGRKFGSGKPSLRCKYCNRAILASLSCSLGRIVYVHLFVGKIFHGINFCGLSQPRKYFNNENFPSYGMCCHLHCM